MSVCPPTVPWTTPANDTRTPLSEESRGATGTYVIPSSPMIFQVPVLLRRAVPVWTESGIQPPLTHMPTMFGMLANGSGVVQVELPDDVGAGAGAGAVVAPGIGMPGGSQPPL